jgi:hypothetical protein
MPRQNTSTAADTRLSNITAYLTPALTLLDELNDAFGSSFLQPILKTTLSLITAAQVMNLIIFEWQCLTLHILECEEKQRRVSLAHGKHSSSDLCNC